MLRFFRNKPSDSHLVSPSGLHSGGGTTRSVAALPPAPPRVKVNEALRVEVSDSLPAGGTVAIGQLSLAGSVDPKAPVLADISQLPPKAELISDMHGELPLRPDMQRVMAFLRESKTSVLLLVSSEIWLSGRMYSQRERARREAGVDVKFIRATRELVASCYQEFNSNTSIGVAHAGEPTDVEKRAFNILDEAIRVGASDLHIEARQRHAEISVRIDGFRRRLESVSSIAFDDAVSIGRVLYNVHADASGKEAGWDPKRRQDAVIEYMRNGAHVQLRFTSAPIYPAGGFQIVIRLLRMNQNHALKLESIGYSGTQMRSIEVALSGSSGLVLLAGPMGAGKSTAMQALIGRVQERRGAGIKIVTVEDPVEYVIPGACQMGVPQAAKDSDQKDTAFADFLRGTVRQDADIVMVGEIRDSESAKVVKDLVLVGKKVFSTLHASTAFQAYLRLREIGVPWDLLTTPGFVSGIVVQRLLPLLCPKCSVSVHHGGAALTEDLRARLKPTTDVIEDNLRVRGDGCEHCGKTGYKGRVVCAEVLIPDATILELLKKDEFVAAEQYWMKKGSEDSMARSSRGETWVAKYPTALAQAIIAMRNGLIDPMDVESNIDLLTKDDDSVTAFASSAKAYQGGLGSALARRASRTG